MTNRRMIAATMALAAWAASPRFAPADESAAANAPRSPPPRRARNARSSPGVARRRGTQRPLHHERPGIAEEGEVHDPRRRKKKLNDTVWIFNARIQYGDKDVTVPVPMKVEWAGDTPVASMTDMPVPGLGTFTARVIFFRNRYAGTWQHGDEAGGHLFGTFAKAAVKAD